MNKTLTLLLATLLLAPRAALHAADSVQPTGNGNLVINAGFEQGLQGWWVHPRNSPQSGVVNAGVRSGQGVLRVQVSNDNRFPDGTFEHYWDPLFCIEQTLGGLKPKTWYEMSLWARTSNAISFRFGANGPDWYSDYLPLKCPTWQRFSVMFRTDENQTTKKIFLRTFHLAEEVLSDDVAVAEARESEGFGNLASMTKVQVAQLDAVKSQAVAAGLDKNAYVKMGLYLAARYLDRVQRPDIQKRQTAHWTSLQLREVASVLDATAALVRRPLPDVPPIPLDHPKIDRGVFVAGKPPSPIFYGGYMGIHNDEDVPSFAGMGVSSIVIKKGPNSLGPDGNRKWALDGLSCEFERAQRAHIKADMLLSPHWFRWMNGIVRAGAPQRGGPKLLPIPRPRAGIGSGFTKSWELLARGVLLSPTGKVESQPYRST